jgi:aspartate/glutamate racemase
MYDIRVNGFENRLFVALRGTIEQPEAAQGYNKIAKAVNSLVPGFTLITDIRELEPATADVRLIFLNTMQLYMNSEMAIEVRVIHPKNPTTAQIFQRISRSIGYTAEEVFTVAEAERIIDKFMDG